MSDIRKAIHALGIDFNEDGDELQALCPMHFKRTGKADGNPSWSINENSGLHLCFSCGYKGNLLSLICDIKGFTSTWGAATTPDFEAAKYWLLTSAALEPEDLLKALEKSRNRAKYEPPVPMSEARLAVFSSPPDEPLLRRRLAPDACDLYEVLWDWRKQNWITPLRDAHTDELLGWQEKGEYERYFKNRPRQMKKSLTLFGKQMIGWNDTKIVVVVESPLDAVRVFGATDIPAVATCGSFVSDEQIQLLSNAHTVIWALDNPYVDKAGRAACASLLKQSARYGVNAKFFNYDGLTVKDPGEMSNHEIRDSIEAAVDAMYGPQAYMR